MFYTYILKSAKQKGAIYVGYTKDLKSRLLQHNNAKSKYYSSRYSPWLVETYLAFDKEEEAKRFEKYLKSSSGKAFMSKHLISNNFKKVLKKFNNGRLAKLR